MTPRLRLAGCVAVVVGMATALCAWPEPAAAKQPVAAAKKSGDAKRRPVARPQPTVRKAVRAAPRAATARSGTSRGPAARLPAAPPPPTLETRVAPLPVWENRPDWKPLSAPFLYPVPETAPDNS